MSKVYYWRPLSVRPSSTKYGRKLNITRPGRTDPVSLSLAENQEGGEVVKCDKCGASMETTTLCEHEQGAISRSMARRYEVQGDMVLIAKADLAARDAEIAALKAEACGIIETLAIDGWACCIESGGARCGDCPECRVAAFISKHSNEKGRT
jgi:hypothetical protein